MAPMPPPGYGAPYSPSTQILQSLAGLNKSGAQSGVPINAAGGIAPMQSPNGQFSGIGANSLNQIHALSQTLGYDPSTVFGQNLGGVVAQVPAQQNNSDPTGGGQQPSPLAAMTQPNTGNPTTQVSQNNGGTSAQTSDQNQNNFWSKLWSLYGGGGGQASS